MSNIECTDEGLADRIKAEVLGGGALNSKITAERVAALKSAALKRIEFDFQGKVTTDPSVPGTSLMRIDKELAAAAGRITREGLAKCPEMSDEQAHHFRLLVVKTALESIDPALYPTSPNIAPGR